MAATYTIKNSGSVDRAFKVRGGHEIVPAGKEREVTTARVLTEAQIDAFGREGVKITKAATVKSEPAAATGPQATHRGGGSYSVMDGDKELAEKLTKDEAEAFNKLDAAAKAKFIADRKAA